MSWAWGVDPDSKAAHFGLVCMTTGKFQTNACNWNLDVSPGRRLMECRAQTIRFTEALMEHFPPTTIAIERPMYYRRPNPALMMHAGVIAEAVGTGSALAPWFVNTGEWRNAIGLKGNCTKDVVVEWARSKGWRHGSVDQAEALGIAFGAAEVFRDKLGVAA